LAGRRSSQTVQVGNRAVELGAGAVNLPAASAPPAATPAVLVSAPPLATRENFAFAPYWTLAQSPTFDLNGLSTLAYFSIGVNPDGTLLESGPGWNGFESQDLADLITRAHATGERVVLTVNDFDQSSLDELTSSASAPTTLAATLVPMLESKNLDGVNFDFEGAGSADQGGLTHLIATVSAALRAADPHWQITMDTYASSAGDPGGFYDIPALAQSVDAFFVMAYELNLAGTTSATAPLTSGQFSDLQTIEQYTAVVPASKVILGTPFFGIDWPTDNGTLGATSTGGGSDVADAQVQDGGHPQYWDPVTQTAWTSYLVGTQWHESYYESTYALYDVAQLAARDAVRGVGIWALGMEDDGPQMIAALDGFAPAGGPGSTGPQGTSASPAAATTTTTAHPAPTASTTTSAPSGTTTSTTASKAGGTTTTTVPVITAVYGKVTVSLTMVPAGGVDTIAPQGTIQDFSTTDPALACLNGKTLNVYTYGVLSSKRVAVAQTPGDCVNQEFTFPA
jgi:spore germination protein YaaH